MDYIADYWREAPGKAWRDAWAFMRGHIWFALVTELAVLTVNLLRIGFAYVTGAASPDFHAWRDLAWGVVLTAATAVLIWLWHLIIVVPARLRQEVNQLSAEKASQQQDSKKSAGQSRGGLTLLSEHPRKYPAGGFGLEARFQLDTEAEKGGAVHILCSAPIREGFLSIDGNKIARLENLLPKHGRLRLERDLSAGTEFQLHVSSIADPIELENWGCLGSGQAPDF